MSYKYRAFLSYRSSDASVAERLHTALERYVVPRALADAGAQAGLAGKRLGRIFRDRDEARSAERIESAIAEHLSQSEQLIVLCSPAAAAPDSWVHREIELFRKLRPDGAIHAVIGAGDPPACFPAALQTPRPDGSVDVPLASDLRPTGLDGREKAVVRFVAGILGVDFDDLWQRELRQRKRQRIVGAAQLTAVAMSAAGVFWLGNYYRTHAIVELNASSLQSIARDWSIEVREEDPGRNGSTVLTRERLGTRVAQILVPATNVILRMHATFPDGKPRGLAHHLMLTPGLNASTKHISLDVPSASDIQGHPGMAYVPAATWMHGTEAAPRRNASTFWIDIRPPTVMEFLPIAEALARDGLLQAENSYLVTATMQARARVLTGVSQLADLNASLGEIVGTIAQDKDSIASAPGDIVVGASSVPCDSCPAPMTRLEATQYCANRAMQLPTASEWELAVRGVDGRIYPWGNRFDPARANVSGLPDVGAPAALKSVFSHREQVSPFGLFDTVGNAGDWVQNDLGAYEAVYMGATYRYNPEDATSFRMLPITSSDMLVRELTARCAVSAGARR